MNFLAVRAIYRFEMARTGRTLLQSVVDAGDLDLALLRRVRRRDRHAHHQIDGVSYGAFIVPGLIMLIGADREHLQRLVRHLFPEIHGTIYEVLSAPVSYVEIVLAYVGAAATKSIILGLIILATAHPVRAAADRAPGVDAGVPGADRGDLQPVRLHHRHLGQQLSNSSQIVPMLIVTPLTFLGGSFYSINMLPGIWQKIALFNPVVYLISGFRWSFYGIADVRVGVSLA
jgi:ABC-2 type transport system permease protein